MNFPDPGRSAVGPSEGVGLRAAQSRVSLLASSEKRLQGVVRARLGALPVFFASGRVPVHPGHFLLTRFVQPMGLSQEALARRLGISRRRLNELIRGHRAITPDTAVRLAWFFGTDPGLFMGLQQAWERHQAMRRFLRGETTEIDGSR